MSCWFPRESADRCRISCPGRGIWRTHLKENTMYFPVLTPRRLIGLLATAVCTAALMPVAALAATTSPAAPAIAARTSASATSIPAISVNSATLVANGAAIRVVFTATCGANDAGSVSSTTTQAVGDRVAQGTTQTGFTCTGKSQQVSALAAANVNGAPFRPGIAVVMASVSDCPGANCTGASTDKVLSIRR
jgi:hypothetical protein